VKLEEAIEINEENRDFFRIDGWEKQAKAVQLGIEALKFFKDLENRGALPADVRLPGETKE